MLTQIRFWNSTPLIFRGVNSFGMGLPSGCGSTAVPAAGICAGVKYGMPGAGVFSYWRACEDIVGYVLGEGNAGAGNASTVHLICLRPPPPRDHSDLRMPSRSAKTILASRKILVISPLAIEECPDRQCYFGLSSVRSLVIFRARMRLLSRVLSAPSGFRDNWPGSPTPSRVTHVSERAPTGMDEKFRPGSTTRRMKSRR